ncbi:MAG TPA: asparagine synthase (glutamine-hydrolyzing) [Myxococcota bacterium]|jgi:asparagine synthase (glutamine-hydrolysing)
MCGIAGVVIYGDAPPVGEAELLRLRDAQRHRGPDGEGIWIAPDGRIGLGHRRLAIVDLSPLGSQPMSTPDGRLRVVFNGEIYNFRQLRAELEARGCEFRSQSDTEVLLHGWREWGLGLLDRLRGMFAFALHDAERRETLIARDPLGIKPCYLLDDGRRLLFASEAQALRAVADDGGIDPDGLAGYLLWGSIAPPRTLYRRIRALPAGSWLRVREGAVEAPTAYFRLEDEFGRAQPMAPAEAAEALRTALLDSVRHHLVADVPVGAFLSGGVDSSALVGLMAELRAGPIRTVTLAFDDPALDESGLARLAAQRYGTDHHEVPIRVEAMRKSIGDAIRSLDLPSVDGINTYFVSEAAAKTGLKVAVSGVGGDELFGGYATFQRVPSMRRNHDRIRALPGGTALLGAAARGLPSLSNSRLTKLARAAEFAGDDEGAYWALRGLFSPAEAGRLLEPEMLRDAACLDPRQELRERLRLEDLPPEERISALEMRRYLQVQLLRDTDATGMRHSLEIRTPLVDRDLLRAVTRIPAGMRCEGPAKRGLREAVRPPIPEQLWNRRKRGFVLPFEAWLREGGLLDEIPELPGIRADEARRVVRGFRGGSVHWSRVWALGVLPHFLR